MTRHWIYMNDLPAKLPEDLHIDGEEARHALRARRLSRGNEICLFDGRGTLVTGVIIETGRDSLKVHADEATFHEIPLPRVHVLAAAPKGERAERMVEGLSQVAAAEFTCLSSERSVVHPRQTRIDRWRRNAVEAAKQCKRTHLLQINDPVKLTDYLAENDKDNYFVLDASGIPYRAGGAENITLFVGPEGGWSQTELSMFRDAGTGIISLGPHIMRVETAAVVGTALIINQEQNYRNTH